MKMIEREIILLAGGRKMILQQLLKPFEKEGENELGEDWQMSERRRGRTFLKNESYSKMEEI